MTLLIAAAFFVIGVAIMRGRIPAPDKAFLLGAAASVFGIALMAVPHVGWFPIKMHVLGVPLETLLEELGSAFLIAGLLALSLERILVSRLTRDVAHGVEVYYLTYGLPTEFADEVMYVRDLKWVRKDYVLRCWLRSLDADRVTAQFQVSFTVVNYSSESIKVEQAVEIEEVGEEPNQHQIVKISRTGADITDEDACVLYNCGTKYRGTAAVRPNKVDPHNTFEYVVKKVFPKRYYSETFVFRHPVVNVRVVLEEVPDDIDFEVSIGHRSFKEVQTMPVGQPRTWILDRAFFPGAGVLLEWKKKPPVAFAPEASSDADNAGSA